MSAQHAKGRTPKEVLASFDQQYTGSKAALPVAQPGAKPPAVPPEAKPPAVPLTHAQYIDTLAPVSMAGRMIKFSKDGTFIVTDDESVIDEDVQFIALIPETLIGWIKFNGEGNPPTREMGLLYDGYQMPVRESLGDMDEATWEMGLDGRPADPWVHAVYLVLQRVDTSELFTFVAMSKTARRAVGVLLRHYDRMQRTNPGYLPLVVLKIGGYQHRDARVGWVKTPVLAAVGQVPGDSAVKSGRPAEFNESVLF